MLSRTNPPDTNEGKTFIGKTTVTITADGIHSFTFSPAKAVSAGRTQQQETELWSPS
jgi:hypothetical protein